MSVISIDVESRSAVNLLTEGGYNYWQDPSTELICMGYAVDYGEPKLWLPGDPVPEVFHGEHTYTAFNAAFERGIWDYIMSPDHGFPVIPLESWFCTMFVARANNLPGALSNCARCLGTAQQKQKRGRELIKLLCVPMADGGFCKDPDLLQEMYEYNLQDVRAEMDVLQRMRQPTSEEWDDYFVNERINDRGIRIDRALCEAAQFYAAEEESDLIEIIEKITEGLVTKARGEKLKEWIVERLTEEETKVLVKYRNGEKKLSLDKYNRSRLLDIEDLDPDVREVVSASDAAQRSSVAKYKAMTLRADPDTDRVQGAFLANGASGTGRYASRGLQLHNYPREVMPDPLEVRADFIDQIVAEDITGYYGMPMMTVLSRMLRPSLIPADGYVYLDSDYASIEGRTAPWLCGEDDLHAEAKLNLYRSGQDTYKIAAARIYNCTVDDVDKDQRQNGKVAELALQFGGGAKAFVAMARNYGLVITDAEAEKIKHAWRRANPWAPAIWKACEHACFAAIHNPGEMFDVGRIIFFAVPDILCGGLTLFCQLPCGRVLTYPDARIELVDVPWDGPQQLGITALKAAWTPKQDETEWPRVKLYGGIIFQNAVQGTAASLIRWAMREMDYEYMPIVMHIHDQVIAEVPIAEVDEWRDRMHHWMNAVPSWAEGLPVQADVETVERFGKS